LRTGPLGEAIYACILVLCVGGGARGQAAALRVRTDSERRFAQELTRLHGVIMNKEENADPLGPVEEEFVTDPGIYRRVFWLLLGLGALLVGLGLVFHDYDIELWLFGGFAVIMSVVVRVIGSRMVAGRLTLHERGLRYIEGESEMAIRWEQIQRAQIVRIPIKMEGLVTVDYNYEITVFGSGGRVIELSRAFLDQVPGGRVKELVRRFEQYESRPQR